MSRNRFHTWRQAICESDLPPMTRLVLHTLGTFMNAHGRSCYPSIEQIMAASGIKSKTTVIDHIKAAMKAGYLTKDRHGFGGQKWKRAEYEAAFPDDEGGPANEPPSDLPDLPEGGPDNEPPSGGKVVQQMDEGGPANGPKVVQQMDQDKNSPSNYPPPAQTQGVDSDDGSHDGFGEFWSDYPATDGHYPERAQEEWARLDEADRRWAVHAIPALTPTFAKMRGGGFLPHIYLRDRIFTRVPAPVDAPPPPKRPDDPELARIYDYFARVGRLPFWSAWLTPDRVRIEDGRIIPPSKILANTLAFNPTARADLRTLGLTLADPEPLRIRARRDVA